MILIADSGSTKTEWVCIGGEGTKKEYHTRGINPYFLSATEISELIRTELIPQLQNNPVSHIYYYGAGCSSSEKCDLVRLPLQSFFPTAQIDITHDLLGAARAGCGHQKGIAVILGTGSNSCLFDGSHIVANQPSLGFIMGDEGSGGYIGKELLKQYLYNELPANLHESFALQFQLTKDDILHRIYKEPMPNTFAASFTPFVAANISEPAMQQLVLDAFNEFFKRHVSSYDRYTEYPISVIGSIGFVFQQQLLEIAPQYRTTIHQFIQKPMDGLIQFHSQPNHGKVNH